MEASNRSGTMLLAEDASLVSALLERLAAVEERLAELEPRYQDAAFLEEAPLVAKDGRESRQLPEHIKPVEVPASALIREAKTADNKSNVEHDKEADNDVEGETEKAAEKNQKKDKETEKEKEKQTEDDKKEENGPISRVKVVIRSTDPKTGEPVEEEVANKLATSKDLDRDKYAFILRKTTFDPKTKKYIWQENFSEIEILSKGLRVLLKDLLSDFPGHQFLGESPVVLHSPFWFQVYSHDILRDAAMKMPTDETDKQAREDLTLLLDTISGGASGDEKLDKYFKMRDSYKRQTPPQPLTVQPQSENDDAGLPNVSSSLGGKSVYETVQFEDLWTVFPVGTLVYGKPFQDEEQVFVVADMDSWPIHRRGSRDYFPWKLYAWSYDWRDGNFRRTLFELPFEPFSGHLPLTSLPYCPFDPVVCGREKWQAVYDKLVQRGKDFRKYCQAKEGSRLFQYDGKAITEMTGLSFMEHDDESDVDERRRPRSRSTSSSPPPRFTSRDRRLNTRRCNPSAKSHSVRSRVMVDFDSYFEFGPVEGRNGPLELGDPEMECLCSDCKENEGLAKRCRTRFDDHEKQKGDWEDEQYLICPPRVLGYVLEEKQWAQLQVTRLSEIDVEASAWNKKLILPDEFRKSKKSTGNKSEGVKGLLFDLVRSHTTSAKADSTDWNNDKLNVDDIIPGKGKGLVILLYGPPGVGKTLTAEAIAEATRKPLFSISVADVGTKAKHVESNLSRIFSLATKWQAILLIDEADVFLESRGRGNAIQSMDKNALVSVFLRVLEYYQGIMILTTNQIAQFDVAIPSRIHVAIRYESLDYHRMDAIFKGFLDELEEKGVIKDYDAIKEWLEDVVYKERLDGRQIRNIVKTGLGLARAGGGGMLTKEHLKRAYENVSAFKRDFQTQMQRYIDGQENMIK